MICRHYKKGQKLDVAGLNEIIVLIDRSETELTEVALNQWRAELHGPPHKHDQKEQIFFVTSGEGQIHVGEMTHPAKPGLFVYVPDGVVHQTITTSREPLTYILFNAFLSEDKEGHASFADHIDKVKNVRRQQADTGNADVEGDARTSKANQKGKFIDDIYKSRRFEFGSNVTLLLLDRNETKKCEATVVSWPAGNKGAMVAHREKEQTFFVLSGTGVVSVGEERAKVSPGDVVFVPRDTPHTTEAGNQELTYLCLNTIVTGERDKSFEDMYNRVAPARIKRWVNGDSTVGE